MKVKFVSCAVPKENFEYRDGMTGAEFRKFSHANVQSMMVFLDEEVNLEYIFPEEYKDSKSLMDEIKDSDLVIVGGSPYSVNDDIEWLENLKEAILMTLDRDDNPSFFGICFGCQLLCVLLGGSVGAALKYHKGDVPVLDNETGEVLFWGYRAHEERMKVLPDSSRVVAKSEEGDYPYLVQFADDVWGTQIHPENKIEEGQDFHKTRTDEFWRKFFRNGGV